MLGRRAELPAQLFVFHPTFVGQRLLRKLNFLRKALHQVHLLPKTTPCHQLTCFQKVPYRPQSSKEEVYHLTVVVTTVIIAIIIIITAIIIQQQTKFVEVNLRNSWSYS